MISGSRLSAIRERRSATKLLDERVAVAADPERLGLQRRWRGQIGKCGAEQRVCVPELDPIWEFEKERSGRQSRAMCDVLSGAWRVERRRRR